VQTTIEDFLNFLSSEKGFSKNTIAAYQNDLAQFASFVGQQSSPTIDRETVLAFVLDLKEKKYAATTVARKIAALRSYFHFQVGRGEMRDDPTSDLDSPRIGKTLPRSVSAEEIEKLLDATGHDGTPESVRDRAMLELLYATGMRVTELVSLNVDDINTAGGYVRCAGRGARERQIPVAFDKMEVVDLYVREARILLLRRPDQSALFLNHRGDRLTRQGFWLIIKGYAKRAGITSSITPHTLRHSFAAHLVRSGAELRAVQEILGHASISSTQVYTQIGQERLRKEWERAHPLA
jgi:integrase/recombinase XerD